jgi:hypothetical protein
MEVDYAMAASRPGIRADSVSDAMTEVHTVHDAVRRAY